MKKITLTLFNSIISLGWLFFAIIFAGYLRIQGTYTNLAYYFLWIVFFFICYKYFSKVKYAYQIIGSFFISVLVFVIFRTNFFARSREITRVEYSKIDQQQFWAKVIIFAIPFIFVGIIILESRIRKLKADRLAAKRAKLEAERYLQSIITKLQEFRTDKRNHCPACGKMDYQVISHKINVDTRRVISSPGITHSQSFITGEFGLVVGTVSVPVPTTNYTTVGSVDYKVQKQCNNCSKVWEVIHLESNYHGDGKTLFAEAAKLNLL